MQISVSVKTTGFHQRNERCLIMLLRLRCGSAFERRL